MKPITLMWVVFLKKLYFYQRWHSNKLNGISLQQDFKKSHCNKNCGLVKRGLLQKLVFKMLKIIKFLPLVKMFNGQSIICAMTFVYEADQERNDNAKIQSIETMVFKLYNN